MARRIGLYGGSFDPIHFGHLISARSLAEQLELDRVVIIPSPRPPHKQGVEMTDARHRLAMARLAVEGDPLFEVSDIELNRAGPSYTFDTVMQFRAMYRVEGEAPASQSPTWGEAGASVSPAASVELFWFIGADSLPELPTWYRIAELVQKVRIVTAARPGWTRPDPFVLAGAIGREPAECLVRDCFETPQIDISATDIRARVASGRSIRYLTPESVSTYIEDNRLYR